MVQWFNQHWYKLGDEYLPSVTTIIGDTLNKPYLQKWIGEVGNEQARLISTRAMELGSRVHNACDLLNKGHEIALNNNGGADCNGVPTFRLHDQFEYAQVIRYATALEILNARVLCSEQRIFNPKDGYAGTIDGLIYSEGGAVDISSKLELEKGYYIVDIKTGKSIWEEYQYQMGAYAEAFKYTFPKKKNKQLKGALIIHTNSSTKKGRMAGLNILYFDRPTLTENFKIFKCMLDIWKARPHSKPKDELLPATITLDPKRIFAPVDFEAGKW